MDEDDLIRKLSNRFETIFDTLTTLNGVSSHLNMTVELATDHSERNITDLELNIYTCPCLQLNTTQYCTMRNSESGDSILRYCYHYYSNRITENIISSINWETLRYIIIGQLLSFVAIDVECFPMNWIWNIEIHLISQAERMIKTEASFHKIRYVTSS